MTKSKNEENITFSIGYNGNIDELQKIIDTDASIESVYTGGVINKINGGRPQYISSLKIIEKQIALAHKKGIKFEIALNAPCGVHGYDDKTWWTSFREYIKDLQDSGIDSLIVSHPFYIKEIKNYTSLSVVLSTINEVATPRSALLYESMGVDIIVPSMNINYNIENLLGIKKSLTKTKLRLMVNESCLGDCPWRRFHHNSYSHSNRELDFHFECKSIISRSPFLILTNNVIRPENLPDYFQVTKNFKIVGRTVPIDLTVERLNAYSSMRYNGNYLRLFDSEFSKIYELANNELEDLYVHKIACDKVCTKCHYCEKKWNTSAKKSKRLSIIHCDPAHELI